ncbi:MAG: hypothetical protein HOO86_07565 [Bacteroidales bacterium]|nr:hypothetical protein [Bacteroidales bacterium]
MSNIENIIAHLDQDVNLKTTFFDTLEDWYRLERQKIINIKKFAPYIAYFIIAIPVCLIFFACLLNGFLEVLIFLIIISAVIMCERRIKVSHKRSVNKYFDSIDLTYRKINTNDFPDLKNTLNKLLNNVGLKDYEVKMFFDRNNHYVPAVCERIDEQGKIIYFLLSRNLLMLHNLNRILFESIIYHELGHINQHDTNLWIERNLEKEKIKYTWIAYIFSIPTILFRLLANSNAKKHYKQERRNAEHYADLYSIINSKNFGIVGFLEGNYLSDSEDHDHPLPKARIDFIEKIVNKVFLKIKLD